MPDELSYEVAADLADIAHDLVRMPLDEFIGKLRANYEEMAEDAEDAPEVLVLLRTPVAMRHLTNGLTRDRMLATTTMFQHANVASMWGWLDG